MSTKMKRKKLPTARQYREAAKELHQEDGKCDIDGNAKVSRESTPGEEGAYVQAWVWVPREDVDKDYQPGMLKGLPGFCAEPQDMTISTHCGSMTRAEFREHIKGCQVCADDAEKRTDL